MITIRRIDRRKVLRDNQRRSILLPLLIIRCRFSSDILNHFNIPALHEFFLIQNAIAPQVIPFWKFSC